MDKRTKKLFGLVTEHVNGGTFITIDTITNVTLRGGKANPYQGRVTKVCTGHHVMIFQNKTGSAYDAMVRRRLQKEGKNPATFELSERKWGARIPNTPFIEHKGGHYLEVIFLKAGDVHVEVDGKRIEDPFTIPGYEVKQEAEQGGLDNKVILRTYSVESIVSITIDRQRHNL